MDGAFLFSFEITAVPAVSGPIRLPAARAAGGETVGFQQWSDGTLFGLSRDQSTQVTS